MKTFKVEFEFNAEDSITQEQIEYSLKTNYIPGYTLPDYRLMILYGQIVLRNLKVEETK